MKTTAVKLAASIAIGDHRFDASYHLSEGVIVRQILEKSPEGTTSLSSLVKKVVYGGRARRIYVDNPECGVPFLGGATMLRADISDVKYVSKKYTPDLDSSILSVGEILVTRVGTLGKTVFTNSLFEGVAVSDNVIRIIPNNSISAGCFYAFLASRYGFALMVQGNCGSVIDVISVDYLNDLRIPVFPEAFQRKVHEKIMESARLREEADAALKRAVGLFEQEMNQRGLSCGAMTGSVKCSDIVSSWRRFDAHYQLGKQRLDAEKKNCKVEQVTIASVAKDIFVGNRGKRNYTKNGVPFLSSSDMMLFNAIRESKPISKTNPGLESLLVHENDILISRSGTVGNVVVVGHDLDNCAVSEHALRLVVDVTKISPLYVFCYLKTAHAKSYMEASAYGSVIITLNETFVGAMTMPVFKGSVYDSIVADIGEYKEKLATAADLENEAIGMVEREIESWQARSGK